MQRPKLLGVPTVVLTAVLATVLTLTAAFGVLKLVNPASADALITAIMSTIDDAVEPLATNAAVQQAINDPTATANEVQAAANDTMHATAAYLAAQKLRDTGQQTTHATSGATGLLPFAALGLMSLMAAFLALAMNRGYVKATNIRTGARNLLAAASTTLNWAKSYIVPRASSFTAAVMQATKVHAWAIVALLFGLAVAFATATQNVGTSTAAVVTGVAITVLAVAAVFTTKQNTNTGVMLA